METPMLQELRQYLKNTPLAEIRKDWNEIESLNLGGPTVNEYLDFLERFPCSFDNPPQSQLIIPENMTPNFSGSFFLCNIEA